ncbi:MAG: NAD-dependent epimerase/dehydratase family protein [Omnitrophica WOR_2 bacterium]
MRVVIIGGSGHVGTYLVPKLVAAGHQVINVTRGRSQPYSPHPAWEQVQQVVLDREAGEADGTFGQGIRSLGGDAVIDMVCFKLESCQHLVEALRGQVKHLIHCGTAWVHGHAVQVPITESMPRRPIDDYGIRKAQIEAYLAEQYQNEGFPATDLLIGHMVGKGWWPLNPAGNFNPEVFNRLAQGEELALPNFGQETLHHVHCSDVAQAFLLALENHPQSAGQSFQIASSAALTLQGYAESAAGWFGKEARLKFLPFDEWSQAVSEEDARSTRSHLLHTNQYSIEKAQRLLGYRPRYTSLQATQEAVFSMRGG